jgi:Kef-type K+ transport system membrane component KefB/predicted transcriptional regulator
LNLPSEVTNLTEQVPILGIALILCLFAGKIASKIQLPKVTAFILIGVILGPSVLNLLTKNIVHSLSFIYEVALGLILFNIGGEFHKKLLKEIGKKQALYSLTLSILIFILVTTFCFILLTFTELTFYQKLIICPFLGIIATEAAPPTTLLVMKEYNASGKLSMSITVFLAISTGMAIIGSKILKLLYSINGAWTTTGLNINSEILLFFWSIIGAVLLGVILGLTLSYFEQRETKQGEILLAVVCTILFGQSLSYYVNTDPLLISLVTGFTLVNASSTGHKIHATVKEMGLSLYAIFFVLAGSHIHPQVQLKTMGFIGLAYIISRISGIIISGKIAGSFFKLEKSIKDYIGLSILSHAGAALAIVVNLRSIQEESAQTIITVITSSIFVFEILGPLALRHALFTTNEVDKSNLSNKSKSTRKIEISFEQQWQTFLSNIGIREEEKSDNITNINDIMSSDILSINENSNTQSVLNFINEHTQDCYPVINEEGAYIGLIDMDALHQVINDDSHSLILAKSLIRTQECLEESVSFETATQKFKSTGLDFIPIIKKDNKKLLGIISYKKIVLARKNHK